MITTKDTISMLKLDLSMNNNNKKSTFVYILFERQIIYIFTKLSFVKIFNPF